MSIGEVESVLPELDELALGAVHSEEFPTGIARAFIRYGVRTWADVARLSEAELLVNKGFGTQALRQIRAELFRRGLAFRREPPPPGQRFIVAYGPNELRALTVRSGVYFIQCHTFVKIGLASNVRKRFMDIRQGIPFPVRLLGVVQPEPGQTLRECEKSFHQRFRSHHHVGEWFIREEALDAFCRDVERATREANADAL
jgi:hypothetical protein